MSTELKEFSLNVLFFVAKFSRRHFNTIQCKTIGMFSGQLGYFKLIIFVVVCGLDTGVPAPVLLRYEPGLPCNPDTSAYGVQGQFPNQC